MTGTTAPVNRQWLQDFVNEQWREAMLAKLQQCGASEGVARRLMGCGIPWTL